MWSLWGSTTLWNHNAIKLHLKAFFLINDSGPKSDPNTPKVCCCCVFSFSVMGNRHLIYFGRILLSSKLLDGSLDKSTVICILCNQEFSHLISVSQAYCINAKGVTAGTDARAKISNKRCSQLYISLGTGY